MSGWAFFLSTGVSIFLSGICILMPLGFFGGKYKISALIIVFDMLSSNENKEKKVPALTSHSLSSETWLITGKLLILQATDVSY